MARIRYASLVQDISGSVGSSTFQKNLYGNTLRSRPRAQKTGSPAQLLQRTYLVQAQNAWQALSGLQRKQWNDYISFSGSSIKRDRNVLTTGHALFIKYHVMRFMNGLSSLGNLYYQDTPAFPLNPMILSDGNILYIVWDTSWDSSEIWFVFKISQRKSLSSTFTPAGLRFMKIPLSDNNGFEFSTLYNAAFGKVPEYQDKVMVTLQYFSLRAPIIVAPKTYAMIVDSY
jgi:hypothetical protein